MEPDSAIPPPPPPPPQRRDNTAVILAGLGGIIVTLLIALVAILATRDSTPATTTSALATATTAIVTTTTAPTTTTESTLPTSFSIESGDVVVAGAAGVAVMRHGAAVAQPLDVPTQHAMAVAGGGIVYHAPIADDYPDFWPPTIPLGAATVMLLQPDGSESVLFAGGAQVRLFDIVEIAEVAPGPSVVLLQSDLLEDFPFRTDSIVVVPLDGSPPLVIPEISGFEAIATGAAWMDGFFAVSLAAEGFEAFDAYDLTGARVPWPANPEPADTRDADLHVMNLARIGDSTRIVYTRSNDFSFQVGVDLVVYETISGVEVASVPILVAGFDASAISTSNDLVAVSVVNDTGGAGWSIVQSTLTVLDTAAFVPDGIDVVGTGFVVD